MIIEKMTVKSSQEKSARLLRTESLYLIRKRGGTFNEKSFVTPGRNRTVPDYGNRRIR